METSRGCPFRCRFCTSSEDAPRIFPIEHIQKDLEVISQMESKVVKVLDRSFHMGTGRTLKLLRAFMDTPASLRFHLELNPDRISEDVMELFAEAPAGKFQFEIGLQTLHEESLKKIDRRMEVGKSLKNIRQLMDLKKHHVHLDLIVGLPDETAAMCEDSLNRVFTLHAHHLQLGTLKLLPGTSLLHLAKQYGYLWDQEPPYEILKNSTLNFQDMMQFKKYAELLERLWNSDLLFNCMTRLITHYYEDQVVNFFREILVFSEDKLATQHLQTDSIFTYFVDFLLEKNWLEQDSLLRELLLWDYLKLMNPSSKSHPWLREQLVFQAVSWEEADKKRFPILELSEVACEMINRRLLSPMMAGTHALWLQVHKRGRPLKTLQLQQELANGTIN